MLEVEPEVASKIQARARERGVSVDAYLRVLIDEKGTESKQATGLNRKSDFACCESGHRVTVPTRRFFLTMQIVVTASTESAVRVLLGKKCLRRCGLR